MASPGNQATPAPPVTLYCRPDGNVVTPFMAALLARNSSLLADVLRARAMLRNAGDATRPVRSMMLREASIVREASIFADLT